MLGLLQEYLILKFGHHIYVWVVHFLAPNDFCIILFSTILFDRMQIQTLRRTLNKVSTYFIDINQLMLY